VQHSRNLQNRWNFRNLHRRKTAKELVGKIKFEDEQRGGSGEYKIPKDGPKGSYGGSGGDIDDGNTNSYMSGSNGGGLNVGYAVDADGNNYIGGDGNADAEDAEDNFEKLDLESILEPLDTSDDDAAPGMPPPKDEDVMINFFDSKKDFFGRRKIQRIQNDPLRNAPNPTEEEMNRLQEEYEAKLEKDSLTRRQRASISEVQEQLQSEDRDDDSEQVHLIRLGDLHRSKIRRKLLKKEKKLRTKLIEELRDNLSKQDVSGFGIEAGGWEGNAIMDLVFSHRPYFAIKHFPQYVSGVLNTTSHRPTFVLSPRGEVTEDQAENHLYRRTNPSGFNPPEFQYEEFFRYEKYVNFSSVHWKKGSVIRNVHQGGLDEIVGWVESLVEYFGR
jgi:hypothetical protein